MSLVKDDKLAPAANAAEPVKIFLIAVLLLGLFGILYRLITNKKSFKPLMQ
jgi:hypothetical protein